MRRVLSSRVLSILCLSLIALAAAAADDSASPNTEIWRKVRADLFGDRPIADDGTIGRIVLEMPARAADAAVVPLAIRVRSSPNDAPTRKLYVVIDRNPSPIAGIFEFGEGSGSPELETRVRIEEYTWVRVIAERADGSLLVAQRFIKAAGGCFGTRRQVTGRAPGRDGADEVAHRSARRSVSAGVGATPDPPSEQLRPGDGPVDALVRSALLRAQCAGDAWR